MNAPKARAPLARRAFGPGERWAAAASVVMALAPLAGCGAGATSAGKPTPTSAPVVSAAKRAQQAAIHRQVTASLHHLAAAHVPYGGIPSYLPKPTSDVDRVLTATATRHVLAIQGDTVDVEIAGAQARMTAVGPDVPDSFIGTNTEQAPTRFDVTLSNVRGTLPVSAGLFSVIDDLGHLHKLAASTKTGGRAPAGITGDGPVTLVLRGTLPSGDGKLRYRPSGRPLVDWDFVVETD